MLIIGWGFYVLQCFIIDSSWHLHGLESLPNVRLARLFSHVLAADNIRMLLEACQGQANKGASNMKQSRNKSYTYSP